MAQVNFDKESDWILYQCKITVDLSAPRSNISLHKIIRQFGIEYREKPLHKDMGGAWHRSSDTSVTPHYIFINSLHIPVRKRFSLGHEIGHFWLGHDSDFSLEYEKNDERETQANRFSEAVNMPAEAIYAVHKYSSTIKEIAHWFRVSEIAAAYRLLHLGLRQEEAEIVISDYRLYSGDPVYE